MHGACWLLLVIIKNNVCCLAFVLHVAKRVPLPPRAIAFRLELNIVALLLNKLAQEASSSKPHLVRPLIREGRCCEGYVVRLLSRLAVLVTKLSLGRRPRLTLKLQRSHFQVHKAYPKIHLPAFCSFWRCVCPYGILRTDTCCRRFFNPLFPPVAVSKRMPHFVAKETAGRIILWWPLVVAAAASVVSAVVLQDSAGPELRPSPVLVAIVWGTGQMS